MELDLFGAVADERAERGVRDLDHPRPMKLRNASAKMAAGMVNIRFTMMGPREFGSRCLRTRRDPLAPSERDAMANSWFAASSCHRTILAM